MEASAGLSRQREAGASTESMNTVVAESVQEKFLKLAGEECGGRRGSVVKKGKRQGSVLRDRANPKEGGKAYQSSEDIRRN